MNTDPIFEHIDKIGEDIKELSNKDASEKVNIRLKTRLMADDENAIPSRCPKCQCILTKKYALQNSSTILDPYNSHDS